MNQLKKDLKDYKVGLLIAVVFIFILEVVFKKTCPSKILFDIDCPGCGLTRACLSFIKLDVTKALEYNATFMFWIITIILTAIDRYIKKLFIRPFPVLLILTSFITITYYIFVNYV